MKVTTYLKDRIGQTISVKMIQEIENLYNPSKNEKNELNVFVCSKIHFWIGQNVITTDVLEQLKNNHPKIKNVSSRKLIEAVRRNSELFGYSYNPFRYPKRGFSIKRT